MIKRSFISGPETTSNEVSISSLSWKTIKEMSISPDSFSYDTSKIIGKGLKGPVYEGTYDSKKVAVKVMEADKDGNSNFFKEFAKTLQFKESPCFMQPLAWAENGSVLYLLQEKMTTNLKDFILQDGLKGGPKQIVDLSEIQRRKLDIMKKITLALKELHERGSFHRELSAEKILLLLEHNDAAVPGSFTDNLVGVKLADFASGGLQKIVEKAQYLKAANKLHYYPAELLKLIKLDDYRTLLQQQGPVCDIHGLGILLLEIQFEFSIFDKFAWTDMPIRKYLTIPTKTQFDREIMKLVDLCCQEDPKKRPATKYILEFLEEIEKIMSVDPEKSIFLMEKSDDGQKIQRIGLILMDSKEILVFIKDAGQLQRFFLLESDHENNKQTAGLQFWTKIVTIKYSVKETSEEFTILDLDQKPSILKGKFNGLDVNMLSVTGKQFLVIQKALKLKEHSAMLDMIDWAMKVIMKDHPVYFYRHCQFLSEQDNADGHCLVGLCLMDGIGIRKDELQAFAMIEKAMAMDNPLGYCLFGFCHLEGIGTNKNEKESFDSFLVASEMNDGIANIFLRYCYRHGIGTDLNELLSDKALEKAKAASSNATTVGDSSGSYSMAARNLMRKFLTKRAETGDVICQDIIGGMVFYGIGVEKDEKEAVRLYDLAAKQGNVTAQCNLGYCYQNGIGVDKNEVEAVRLYSLAADQGNVSAQCNLGICYENGNGVAKNLQLALKYYQLAANQGNSVAQYNLARCYDHGIGVKQDLKQAASLYQLAASKENLSAQCALGFLYQYGLGVEMNEKEATKYYLMAANQGDSTAQTYLGFCYEFGVGIEKDEKEAVKLYKMAADKGNAMAQSYLAFCYQTGIGFDEKDEKEAVRLYKLASDQGLASAQCNLGVCYQFGTGIEKNEKEAVRLYLLAAEQGHPFAQCSLALCYEHGTGIEKNEKEATRLYQLAALGGDVTAQYYIGCLYETGTNDFEKDDKMALKFYQMAADNGDEMALEAAQRLTSGEYKIRRRRNIVV